MDRYTATYAFALALLIFDALMLGASVWLAIAFALVVCGACYAGELLIGHWSSDVSNHDG